MEPQPKAFDLFAQGVKLAVNGAHDEANGLYSKALIEAAVTRNLPLISQIWRAKASNFRMWGEAALAVEYQTLYVRSVTPRRPR